MDFSARFAGAFAAAAPTIAVCPAGACSPADAVDSLMLARRARLLLVSFREDEARPLDTALKSSSEKGLVLAAVLNTFLVFKAVPRALVDVTGCAGACPRGALPRPLGGLVAEEAPPSSPIPGDEHCSDTPGLYVCDSCRNGASACAGAVSLPRPGGFFLGIILLLVFEFSSFRPQFASKPTSRTTWDHFTCAGSFA